MSESEKVPLPGDKQANTIVHRSYYAETDRMGWVYYGNYPAWFERGRTELLRDVGLRYRDFEDGGLFLPVRRMNVRYHAPAKYDDLVSIVTIVTKVSRASVTFLTVVWNEEQKLLAEGEVQLACVDGEGRPAALPKDALEILKNTCRN